MATMITNRVFIFLILILHSGIKINIKIKHILQRNRSKHDYYFLSMPSLPALGSGRTSGMRTKVERFPMLFTQKLCRPV